MRMDEVKNNEKGKPKEERENRRKKRNEAKFLKAQAESTNNSTLTHAFRGGVKRKKHQ